MKRTKVISLMRNAFIWQFYVRRGVDKNKSTKSKHNNYRYSHILLPWAPLPTWFWKRIRTFRYGYQKKDVGLNRLKPTELCFCIIIILVNPPRQTNFPKPFFTWPRNLRWTCGMTGRNLKELQKREESSDYCLAYFLDVYWSFHFIPKSQEKMIFVRARLVL